MKKMNLLIIDDDELIVRAIERFLETKENINVFTETNPIKGMETIKKNKIHILLLDIQMPEMDGIEFLKWVKKTDPLVQVIMLTAYSSLERVLLCFENGANDFVLKPFDTEELWEIINESIKKISRWRNILNKTIKGSYGG